MSHHKRHDMFIECFRRVSNPWSPVQQGLHNTINNWHFWRTTLADITCHPSYGGIEILSAVISLRGGRHVLPQSGCYGIYFFFGEDPCGGDEIPGFNDADMNAPSSHLKTKTLCEAFHGVFGRYIAGAARSGLATEDTDGVYDSTWRHKNVRNGNLDYNEKVQGMEWPQGETWTDFDGPSWIQYDLFRKNKLPGSKKVNLVKFMLRAMGTLCSTLSFDMNTWSSWPPLKDFILRHPNDFYNSCKLPVSIFPLTKTSSLPWILSLPTVAPSFRLLGR